MMDKTEAFVKKARTVHGKKFGYDKTCYTHSHKKIQIFCKGCSEYFSQTPNDHLKGRGCYLCRYSRSTTSSLLYDDKTFRKTLRGMYGPRISVSGLKYEGMKAPITIWCKMCRTHFTKQTRYLLEGIGCPGCEVLPVSRSSGVAIRWIKHEAKKRRIKIQHAGNCGEFKIPNTRWRVDGYNPRTKTVFEFYGDRFHGNPIKFKPDARPNPFSKETADKLYKTTMNREAQLKELGYTVVSMWESEWRVLQKHSFA